MNLRSKNKVNPDFNMSSMTDIIFLLLIFFMLTSSFVTPTGMPVSLPSSASTSIVMEKTNVTITKDLQYFLNDQPTSLEALPAALEQALSGTEQGQGVVVLNVDKSVPVEYFVKVAGMAAKLNAKISIAAEQAE
ncbi:MULTISPECIES: ExbD/TolR family protein [Rufibacter]|uniref:Biopolymer transport protein ExbD n=1 Tax=Rufibacter quisquiliarum TaxID=1549639 RepID=A0A839GRA3_9BACT|nr:MULTISPECIES: biopolymer transporter ExbD [Rufibacter]MBA9077417.1 biopolymer transport protein ExbD [Rufibacter quisquiliarum]